MMNAKSWSTLHMTKNVTANNHLKEQNNEFKLNIRCKLSGPKSSSDQTDALQTRQ